MSERHRAKLEGGRSGLSAAEGGTISGRRHVSARRYRVIQWATGNTGQRALREVIRHPDLELVGVLVYDEAKEGVDAGKLCDEDPTGVLATTDRDAVLAVEADCCVYMPRATGRGQTRAGLTEDELVADIAALLEAGTNIVTTVSDLFARGARLSEKNRRRVLEACERGNSSVWASGSDPGFITETLPMALLSVQRRLDLIEIEEFGDLSHRPSAHMVMEQMRFGKPLSEFDPDRGGPDDRRRADQEGHGRGSAHRDPRPQWRRRPDPVHAVRVRGHGRGAGLGSAAHGLAHPHPR